MFWAIFEGEKRKVQNIPGDKQYESANRFPAESNIILISKDYILYDEWYCRRLIKCYLLSMKIEAKNLQNLKWQKKNIYIVDLLLKSLI